MELVKPYEILLYDKYFKNGDYLVWEMSDRVYELLKIVDIQPGRLEFKFEVPSLDNHIYYLTKGGPLMFNRFKVLEMYT